jgi:8-oxo-dGTP diphosphatase
MLDSFFGSLMAMTESKVSVLPHKISTLIYAFNEKDELLMLERCRPPNLGLWSPFGGKVHTSEGESPHQCAARETFEEIGLQFQVSDFHLTGMVSEQAYEGDTHWLMFMFELKPKLRELPPAHAEGIFEFVPMKEVSMRKIPEADAEVLWPLFQSNRGRFFSVSINCHTGGRMTWNTEENF